MSLISDQDQQTLQKLFEGLEGDVTITNFIQRESPLIIPGQECDYCKETRELLVSLPRFGRVSKAEIYSTKPGKESAWQRFKKPTRENSKRKLSDWPRPVASPSHKWPVS
jgi:hypothetical protein